MGHPKARASESACDEHLRRRLFTLRVSAVLRPRHYRRSVSLWSFRRTKDGDGILPAPSASLRLSVRTYLLRRRGHAVLPRALAPIACCRTSAGSTFMIPRVLRAKTDAEEQFVVRLRNAANDRSSSDAILISGDDRGALYSC